MTAAETLRAAATRLRDLAGAATDGPWTTVCTDKEFGDYDIVHPSPPDDMFLHSLVALHAQPSDAAYIAAMDPIVGAAVADWIDATAKELDPLPFTAEDVLSKRVARWAEAVTVAQAILAGGDDQ